MVKIFRAKEIVEKNTQLLKEQCSRLEKSGLKPRLDVILIGNNPASELYIKNKKAMCEKIGADFNLIRLETNISRADFISKINELNNNPAVTGCFVQLPMPEHLNDIEVTELINPAKDVDGFHSQNIIKLYNNKPSLVSCTPKGIIKLLNEYKVKLEGKHVVVIGRGFIVGKPLALLLQNNNATVTLCHSRTHNIKEHTSQADIIVCAIGQSNFLDSSFLNPDKEQILIDVGINKNLDGEVTGDINFEDVQDKVYAITPVPGGVGPMTVYSLMENLIQATENQLKG